MLLAKVRERAAKGRNIGQPPYGGFPNWGGALVGVPLIKKDYNIWGSILGCPPKYLRN